MIIVEEPNYFVTSRGTKINTISFNDRIRDAVLGGSPFGHPLQQGFVTGLGLQVTTFLL